MAEIVRVSRDPVPEDRRGDRLGSRRGVSRVGDQRVPSPLRRPVPLGVVFCLALSVAACDGPAGGTAGPTEDGGRPLLSLVETLGGADTVGYARAMEVRDFSFPSDHGPHEEFRTEWWYVTGNLSAEDGRDFGFQLTIFRSALAPTAPGGPSAWATNQAYMGHFAVTDVSGERFIAEERFARGAAGLAGARGTPFRVWIEDWTVEQADTAGDAFPLRLRADAEGVELDLTLEAGKPVVLQGRDGLSQKGSEPGNASYYYAHTRMPASGTIEIDGAPVAVSGLTWLDREWSTSALSNGQVGWDWFALQLDDGWEMMVYQLRRADGTADPLSDGVLIDPAGRRIPLVWGTEVDVQATGEWRSPVDGSRYPSGWRIRVPGRGWDIDVSPVLDAQELDVAFRYWEGAVRVSGTGEQGRPVSGRGYTELTGYAGSGS